MATSDVIGFRWMLGLNIDLWVGAWRYVFGLARRGSAISFHLLWHRISRISHEYSLFIIVINLIFMFSLWCIDWDGSFYANRIFMYFCISIGTQGEVG